MNVHVQPAQAAYDADSYALEDDVTDAWRAARIMLALVERNYKTMVALRKLGVIGDFETDEELLEDQAQRLLILLQDIREKVGEDA
jgi:hypothetical protein